MQIHSGLESQWTSLIANCQQTEYPYSGLGWRESEIPKVEDYMSQYKDVFTGEGKLVGQLHLEIDKDVQPVQLPAQKQVSYIDHVISSEGLGTDPSASAKSYSWCETQIRTKET